MIFKILFQMFIIIYLKININEGIREYTRRISRFKKIIKEDKRIYFLYVNEDYLYDNKYRETEFNNTIFKEMLNLELYLDNKYPELNYNIIYIDFVEHKIPINSKIINIIIKSNCLYTRSDKLWIKAYNEFRLYCGKLISNIFNSNLKNL